MNRSENFSDVKINPDVNVSIDVKPAEDVRIKDEAIAGDMGKIYGQGWDKLNSNILLDQEIINNIGNWIGADAVSNMRHDQLQALINSIASMPRPALSSSFVWKAIRSPDDIEKVASALYNRELIDEVSVSISREIGANNQFRELIEKFRQSRGHSISSLVDTLTVNVDSLSSFVERMDDLVKITQALFPDNEITIGAMLVALVASQGIVKSSNFMKDGFKLSKRPNNNEFEIFEQMRQDVAIASNMVNEKCGVAPIMCNAGVLSGVRRSIASNRAGDFVFAVESLGGEVVGIANIGVATEAFSKFFEAEDKFIRIVQKYGYLAEDISSLMAHILLRRHMMTAAEELNIPWDDVEFFLRINIELDTGIVLDCFKNLAIDGASGRLLVACENKSANLECVRTVVYRTAIDREYFLQAGRRVSVRHPEATIDQIIKVIAVEGQLRTAEVGLSKFGVETEGQRKALDAHLKWMVSAFALPVDDEAIEMIISSSGEIMPFGVRQTVNKTTSMVDAERIFTH